MIIYAVIIYLVWFVKAPWWLYIPCVAGLVAKCIGFILDIYDAGKESK